MSKDPVAFVSESEDGAQKSVWFECPGCGVSHAPRVVGPRPRWTWNNSLTAPTFKPSILAQFGRRNDAGKVEQVRCHSFVTDGQIRFLSDCTHDLAGQTVPLPPLEGDWP